MKELEHNAMRVISNSSVFRSSMQVRDAFLAASSRRASAQVGQGYGATACAAERKLDDRAGGKNQRVLVR
jgi:hypothetical protein